jgi:hypothetical protein
MKAFGQRRFGSAIGACVGKAMSRDGKEKLRSLNRRSYK